VAFHLECTRCGQRRDPAGLPGLCDCGAPLWVRHAFDDLRGRFTRPLPADRPWTLWRYREVLPILDGERPVTLGEGGTPLLPAPRLAREVGVRELWIKDEGSNPTGSFKARGLAMAVTRALHGGARALVIPSAGNAGHALAAYGARAGLPVRVYVPRDAPAAVVEGCRRYGADVVLVQGLIDECGRRAAEWAKETGAFDVSTLREPYRVEGKKTMAYELVEQLDGRMPDVVVYPTGGGTGLIGMWKAFGEMQALGWTDRRGPRMVAVQAEGCAPIVRAFHAGAERAEPWPDARTVAAGLRVPAARGDFLILAALRESGGTAVAVSDGEMLRDAQALAEGEGISAAPEGGATLAALRRLRAAGAVERSESVVCFNTGAAWTASGHPAS
jgi:threonine synthase